MTDRSKEPWCHVPQNVTADDLLARLWFYVETTCGCGGKGECGCVACEVWYFVTEDWEGNLTHD